MKNSTSLLLVVSAIVASAFTATLASAADAPAESATVPPPPSEHRGPPPEVMADYDVDQNGVLDEDERAVHREDVASGKFVPPGVEGRHRGPERTGRPGMPPEIRAQYDANKDGQLDDAERAALRADVASGKLELPARDPEGRPHRRQPPPEIMAQYDANQDGQLDDAEHTALRTDIRSGKITPPRGPGGRSRGHRGGQGGAQPAPAAGAEGEL